MTPQFDNIVVTSFLLMVDHEIQKRGAAFSNTSGLLYPVPSNLLNTYTYASPYKQWCNDTSIPGATVASGVYLNNNFVTIGQSGLDAINHYAGVVYFTGAPLPVSTVVSAAYAVKEYSINLVDQTEWKLLFETKFVLNRQIDQTKGLTGLPLDTKTIPAIFIKTRNQDTRPFALGGYDNSMLSLRAIVIADTEFSRVAACNILKNMNYRPIPITTGTPFDFRGRMTGINYNYDQLSADSRYSTWILGVRGADLPQVGQYENVLKNMGRVDFDISTVISHTY